MGDPSVPGMIVARSDSVRLPAKVLRPLRGLPMLELIVKRLRAGENSLPLVLATTQRRLDDELASRAEHLGLEVFRGATADVAGRLVAAAATTGTEWFVRINGDCPFPDPALIDVGIRATAEDGIDLVSNLPGRTYPYGISVEVIRTGALARLHRTMTDEEREHVTLALYNDPSVVKRILKPAAPSLGAVRLAIDTVGDLERMRQLAGALEDRILTADYRVIAETAIRLGVAA